MRSFIIHMSGTAKRNDNVQRLLAELPDAEVAQAVNGRDPSQVADMRWQDGDLFKPHYPFPLSQAEIGCFLSHRACWKQIVDRDLPYALIVEDDLLLNTGWQDALALAQSQMTPDMYVRLPTKSREIPEVSVAQNDKAALFLPRRIGLQTVCQIVGKNAAKRLLDATSIIDRPVDTFLQMHWITDQPIHTLMLSENHAVVAEIGGSTIQKKIRGGKNIAREFKRGWYRAQVALRPQRT